MRQPVESALLLLYPASGGESGASVPVDQEGNFLIPDVQPGEYKVVVQGTAGSQQAKIDPAMLKKMPPDKAAEMKEKLTRMNTPATIKFPKKYDVPPTEPWRLRDG